jgi:hypothetical protein
MRRRAFLSLLGGARRGRSRRGRSRRGCRWSGFCAAHRPLRARITRPALVIRWILNGAGSGSPVEFLAANSIVHCNPTGAEQGG